MQCPDCGYMLSAFDKECPRCASYRSRGLKPPTGLLIPKDIDPIPIEPEPPPSPLAAPQPAPEIVVRRGVSPGIIVLVALAVLFFAWIISSVSRSSDDDAIIEAAKAGFCQQMAATGPGADCSDTDAYFNKSLLAVSTPSVVRADDNHATVTWYSGASSMDSVNVVKDETGEWHPLP